MRPRRKQARKSKGQPVQFLRTNDAKTKELVCVNPYDSVVPFRFRTHLHFDGAWVNTTAAPGFYDWIFRGNSVYDPDYTLGGNSAWGFDQVMTIWNFYKVLASKITVTITDKDAANPMHCCIIPMDSPVAWSAASALGAPSHPDAKTMILSINNGSKRLSHYATTANITGVKDIDDAGYQANSATDPAHAWYWHVIMWNDSSAQANCNVGVHIDYETELHGPVNSLTM